MRVLFLVSVTSVSIRARKGQIVDMSEDKARTWADGKRAVLVDDQPEPPVSVPPSIEDEAETEEVEASEEDNFEEEDEEETEEPTPAPAPKAKQTKKRNKRKR